MQILFTPGPVRPVKERLSEDAFYEAFGGGGILWTARIIALLSRPGGWLPGGRRGPSGPEIAGAWPAAKPEAEPEAEPPLDPLEPKTC